ncbi:MAG: cation:dicarboxylate symporter family transporter [Thermodesulfobacteriota bacterium]
MNIRSIGFTAQVIVGLILGIFAGVFFGEYCKVLAPIGSVFVMLLEAVLYPFLVSSLIYGLGRLSPENFGKLFRRGWHFYILIWAVALSTLAILLRALPVASPLLIDPAGDGNSASRFLLLIIPKNLFIDFTSNFVPAVVVFSILLGLAVQRIEKKGSALELFDFISKSCLLIWKGIIKFSPIAVFALFANLFGTITVTQLDSLVAYLLLFIAASLILTFWIVPGLISAFIDFPFTRIVREMRGGIFMSAVTMLPVTSIPYIFQAVDKFTEEKNFDKNDEFSIKETVLSFSYPLAQLGNLFVYLFMGFCIFYYKHPINFTDQLLMPVLSLLSSFGTPLATLNSISFMSSWLGFTQNTTDLYVELMTITRYFQVIASTAGIYFITIVVTFAFFKRIKFNKSRFAVHLILPFIVLCVTSYGIYELEAWLSPKRPNPYLSYSLPAGAGAGINATVFKDREAALKAGARDTGAKGEGAGSLFSHIQRTGVLRIGYNAAPIPFSYFNDKGELVGYDVSFAYDLAKTLNVDPVFMPYTWEGLTDDLKAGRFDMAISGIYITDDRIKELQVSHPYYESPVVMIVPSEKAGRYVSRDKMSQIKDLRIGVFNDTVLAGFVRQTFPQAQVVYVTSLEEMLSFRDFDAIIWTEEQALILASLRPGISVVLTKDLHSPLLFAYMMPPGSDELLRYINYWLELRDSDGFTERMKEYWFQGKTRAGPEPRWCVIRDMLHWVK